MGAYALALLLTLGIEVPVYVATLGPPARALRWPVLPWSQALVLGITVNIVSHPVAFLVVFPLLRQLTGRTAALVLVEIGVLVAEAMIIGRRLSNGVMALRASSLANLASLTIGSLLVA